MTKDNNPKTLKTDHIFRMADDTGMLQHSLYGIPNRSMAKDSFSAIQLLNALEADLANKLESI